MFRLFLFWSANGTVVVDNSIDNVNTFDVFIQLFDDENCHFQSENLLLTTTNCYANRYEKPTDAQNSIGLAYQVSIVNYFEKTTSDGGSNPRKLNIYYYKDACNSEVGQPLQLIEGQCSGLQGRPIFHTLHGWFTLRRRTVGGLTPECTGGTHVCSTIRLLHTHFYPTAQCTSSAYRVASYPVGPSLGKGACLRYNNGTQFFSIDDQNPNTIFEYDYPESPDCTENGVKCIECVKENRYQVQVGHCYTLLERDSFQWRLDPDPLAEAETLAPTAGASGLPLRFLSAMLLALA